MSSEIDQPSSPDRPGPSESTPDTPVAEAAPDAPSAEPVPPSGETGAPSGAPGAPEPAAAEAVGSGNGPAPEVNADEADDADDAHDEDAPRADPAEVKARIRDAADKGNVIDGKVVAIARGGFEVDLGAGVIGLCPFNQIDLRQSPDQLSHLHQTYSFNVTLAKRKRIQLSRRRILEKEVRKAARDARKALKIGSTHQGVVSSLTDFGAFVDIGGVQGLVHVSEISHQRLDKPADRLAVGNTVQVKVLKSDRRRVSLSIKALEEDPWTAVKRAVRPNEVISGKMLRMTEFGIFVQVRPGVDGLLHASELPEGETESFSKRVEAGESLDVMVLKVESAKKRISLALAPEGVAPGTVVETQNIRVGSVVTGTVHRVDARAGVLIRLGPGRLGLIPPNETATSRQTDLRQAFPEGKEIKALVIGTERGDGGRRMRLSIRRAERQEERRQLDEYRKSSASGAGSFATLGDFFRKSD